VRQAAVLLVRGGCQRDRLHAGHLRGYDVHHHAGDQRGETAGDVKPHALDRDHPLGDRAARNHPGGDIALELGLAGGAQPPHRLLQAGAHARVERGECLVQRGRRDHDVVLPHVVEPLGVLRDRGHPASAYLLADRAHDVQGSLDVELRARHDGAVVARLAPEVDTTDQLGIPAKA
jgi:hypothetical protein